MTHDEIRALRRPHLVALSGINPKARDGSKAIRKVGIVVGDSRTPGKVRIATWSQAARCWSNVHTARPDELEGPAPDDWTATRAARRHVAENGAPR